MADAHDLTKTKKSFAAVGIALLVFTVVTVTVGLAPIFDFGPPGPDGMDFVLGLAVATVKASLVALIFMHLNHEKKAIYWIFFGSMVFFAFMIALIMSAKSDPIHFNGFNFGLPF